MRHFGNDTRMFRFAPFIAFDGDGGGGSGSGGGGGNDGGGDGGGRTFTQDDLNAHLARERHESDRRARKAIEDALGMPPEEAKAALDKAKAQQREQMDEAAREKAEAEEAKQAAARAEAAANERVHKADVTVALLAAGAKPDRVEKLARLVDCEVGAKAEEIKTAVESVKTEFAEQFAADTNNDDDGDKSDKGDGQQQQQRPPSGDPTGNKPPAGGGNRSDGLERGKAEAMRRQQREPAGAGAQQ